MRVLTLNNRQIKLTRTKFHRILSYNISYFEGIYPKIDGGEKNTKYAEIIIKEIYYYSYFENF